MTQTIERPPLASDRSVFLLALFDAMSARTTPQTTDQLELRLFGLSGDWISRKLNDEFLRWGTFPLANRLLLRWRSSERTRDRDALEGLLTEGAERGLWESIGEGDRARWHLRSTASDIVEIILRESSR